METAWKWFFLLRYWRFLRNATGLRLQIIKRRYLLYAFRFCLQFYQNVSFYWRLPIALGPSVLQIVWDTTAWIFKSWSMRIIVLITWGPLWCVNFQAANYCNTQWHVCSIPFTAATSAASVQQSLIKIKNISNNIYRQNSLAVTVIILKAFPSEYLPK